jgi:hypothetical protein
VWFIQAAMVLGQLAARPAYAYKTTSLALWPILTADARLILIACEIAWKRAARSFRGVSTLPLGV